MSHPSLEAQRAEFAGRPFLAMPIAGMLCWALIGVAGALLPLKYAVWVLFGVTGSIFYVGLLVARFTGEDLLERRTPKNAFSGAFMSGLLMSLLVFAIAIPFAQQDITSVPLTFGILSGLMWLPLSWIIRHWVGAFHAFSRTALVMVAWYLWPEQRFVSIPLVIVTIYAVTIWALWRRPRDHVAAVSASSWSHA
ncbi:MAG: hypothetical protein KDJ14_10785 [Xanthomonadales bacterium]|nr:hypothetical protein [Xanthomonadales bacterium]